MHILYDKNIDYKIHFYHWVNFLGKPPTGCCSADGPISRELCKFNVTRCHCACWSLSDGDSYVTWSVLVSNNLGLISGYCPHFGCGFSGQYN